MSAVWLDANGFTRIQRIRTSAGASSILAGLAAASQAGVQTTWESSETVSVPVPAGGTYRPASLKVTFTFICSDNTQALLSLFSPSLAIFQADGQTVNRANPLAAAIITAAIGALVSNSGALAVSCVAAALDPLPQE